jgi:hypothetical protein
MPTEYTYTDWLRAKNDLDAAKANFDEINYAMAKDMIENNVKTELDLVFGTEYQFTVVQSETMRFDEETLLKELGKRAFARIANLKLDKKKLEAAVRDGSIDADLVGRNTVISRNTPYIRHSEYRGED